MGLSRGWSLLRLQGRRAVWYAVVAPAVLSLLAVANSAGGPVAWIAWPVSALVGLALRGAIAAAYLRLTS